MSPPPPDDGAIPLSRIRARLARPRGARQVDALLSATDAAAAVQALSTVELYQLVREVGFADAHELIALASPEQVQGCLDLDIWDRDRLESEALKPWLTALLDAGFEKLGQVWEGLDPELAALTLSRFTFIYDLSLGEEVPDHEDRPVLTTPDTFFAVAITADDEETQAIVHRLIDDLYKADMVMARHTLMSARSEPVAELEEMSYRWRSGRMADLGYADYYDALEVFRPIDARAVVIGEGTEDQVGEVATGDEARAPRDLPVPVAERIVGRSFLARALAEVGDADHAIRLEAAFVILTNKVLSALRVSPGDEEATAFGTDYAIGAVSLGLEIASRGDLERAAEALRTVSLTKLHRLGYTATLRLSRLATALAPRAGAAGEPASSLLAALTAQRPMFPTELDDPPGAGPRPFESADDIRRAAELLTRLALRIAIADALDANLLVGADGPELDDYVRTALVRTAAGGEATAAPLTSAELRAFRRDAFAGDLLSADAVAAANRAIDELLDRAEVIAGRELVPELVAGWAGELSQTFGGLDPDLDPDPRFIGGVITEGAMS